MMQQIKQLLKGVEPGSKERFLTMGKETNQNLAKMSNEFMNEWGSQSVGWGNAA